ncbi:hypothetical protein J4526_04405 [Desulfurococcaceae archaeon MEX13E-LK6-19]|nr:hypothetical protein J4526_04405 [Desulfurococcaceae archaeon MEX13E-LK6-19]
MKKIALIIAYNGSLYKGFQRQPHGETVENSIEQVLVENNVIPSGFSDEEVDYSSSGRTDRGVHAVYQVISFNSFKEPSKVIEIINRMLSPRITAWGYLDDVPWDFNARHWAKARVYLYYLGKRFFGREDIVSCIDYDRRLSVVPRQLVFGNSSVLLFKSFGFKRSEIKHIINCLTGKRGFIPGNLCLVYVGYPFKTVLYHEYLVEFLKENSEVKIFRFLLENKQFLDQLLLYFL